MAEERDAMECGVCYQDSQRVVIWKACKTHAATALSDGVAVDGGWDLLNRLHIEGVGRQAMARGLVAMGRGAPPGATRLLEALWARVEKYLQP